jgi:catechol 2,3-dioxygenase-like lactoylglutathione lyase family enzyme
MRLNQVTVATHDVERAIAFYRTLGLELIVRSPHYARFVCPEGQSTFSAHLTNGPIAASTVVYFECDDLDAKVAALEDAGLRFDSAPADQSWLWREARLKDPDGNPVCLYFAGGNRIDPPWKIDEPTQFA